MTRKTAGFFECCISLSLIWFACSITQVQAQSTLWSWGSNFSGQLGDGTTNYRSLPGQVVNSNGIGFLTNVTMLSGAEHILALSPEGTIWAWGSDDYNQTGGSIPAPFGRRTIPVQVAGPGGVGVLSDVVEVACGWYHSLARKGDGTVWAWGRNRYGMIGNGTTGPVAFMSQVLGPGGIGVLNDVTAIAGGQSHSLAVKANGTVWSWGANGLGQLGNGTHIDAYTPVQVKGADGIGYLNEVVAIGAGSIHCVALKTDGTLWAWGSNLYGQLGDGTFNDSTTPVQVKGPMGNGYLSSIIAVVVCGVYNVALKADGTVWAWGDNSYGQLGNGTTDYSLTPVQVHGYNNIGFLTDIKMIASNGGHCLVIDSNATVWAWGNNTSGQLGDGTSETHTTPVPTLGLSFPVGLAVGSGCSFAIQGQGVINGRITLENRLCIGTSIRFEFRPINGGLPIIRWVNLGAAGTFSFFDIPQGTYNVAVKGSKWLQKVITNVDTSSGGNILDLRVNLLGGDANGDNSIDVLDLDLLIQAFDANAESPNWNNGAADFNSDGSVDVLDLDILIRNFDAVGDE